MIEIDEEKCNGCNLCASVCIGGPIYDGPDVRDDGSILCVECGQCYAVCPKGAITLPGFKDIKPFDLAERPPVDGPTMMALLRGRRSGRACPSGSPSASIRSRKPAVVTRRRRSRLSVYNKTVNLGWRIWSWVDDKFNRLYPQDYNPMYYLGGISNLFFWFVIGTGIVLFLYYKPSLEDAYHSVEYLTQKVPYGQAVRGLHRYGADAMLVFVVLHWLRVWWTDRYRKFRSLAWISGVVLLVLTLLMGVSGYLLVWDERSLMLIRMTQWMVGGEHTWLGKLLVGGDKITDYTLTRFLFFHIGVPFLMLFFLWMHYIRINRPVVYPPALLTLQLFGIVFVACYLFPTVSMAPANPEQMPQAMLVDWFYQWGYVGAAWLQQFLGHAAYPITCLVLVAISVLLFALPYLTQEIGRAHV